MVVAPVFEQDVVLHDEDSVEEHRHVPEAQLGGVPENQTPVSTNGPLQQQLRGAKAAPKQVEENVPHIPPARAPALP
eukprot:CAMPEP_0198220060 /NCGR_PEP_ID=MMETSP1445-20131203/77353_1 /TAXON_ID=36898 /ORGANISM="Pyramimonas sp., Strain CCMP2087" /LENGTH=76 /DNA_ID=CAMNT_0043897691 /DNA_START=119 /DNA_END=346 /DNA_ORIENTATION=+